MKGSKILRLERYLKFHLTEILEELKTNEKEDSNAELTRLHDKSIEERLRWGSFANEITAVTGGFVCCSFASPEPTNRTTR